MRFCVVGDLPEASELLRAVYDSAEHSLSACAVAGELQQWLISSQTGIRLVPTSEEAILSADVDTVIVAVRDSDDSLRCVRTATQAEKHVVVVPPPGGSPAYSFELHLILDESTTAVIPLIHRLALNRLDLEKANLALDAQTTQQLTTDIDVTDTSAAGIRKAIRTGLDLLHASGFRYSQVTALESQSPDGRFLSMLITLNASAIADSSLPPASLTLKPAQQSAGPVRIQQVLASGEKVDLACVDTAVLPERIHWLCQNKQASSRWMEAFSATLELADAVEKSLRRKRTVDVHFDSGSERGVFKSQMTAIGCGVLTFMMFGMVGYLILAQLTDLPGWVLHAVRALWIAPLVIFLLAQALLPLTRSRTPRS
jgi:hypothetical protein